MKHYIALCAELALDEVMDLSQDRLRNQLLYSYTVTTAKE